MSPASRRLRIRAGAAVRRVDVPPRGALTVEGAAEPVPVTRRDRTTFEAVVDGRRLPVWIVDAGGSCQVFVEGCSFTLQLDVDVPEAARAAPPDDGPALSAPMPATVVATRAAPGRSVRAGDVLVVLEAMKMELTVRAPRDGVVDAVNCRAGDLVQPGVPLLTLRPRAGD